MKHPFFEEIDFDNLPVYAKYCSDISDSENLLINLKQKAFGYNIPGEEDQKAKESVKNSVEQDIDSALKEVQENQSFEGTKLYLEKRIKLLKDICFWHYSMGEFEWEGMPEVDVSISNYQ